MRLKRFLVFCAVVTSTACGGGGSGKPSFPTADVGTDHGWGSHQMVIGDAVMGGRVFGTMPELAIGSNDDVGQGRMIPTTSIDQYAATLASWYGLSPSQIADTFPTLANFNSADLGFMQT